MNEQVSTTSRLTVQQRDQVLDLAARLQDQHDQTIDVNDLARAASEAGIAPRFVHMAAQSLNPTVPPKAISPTEPNRLVALSVMGVLVLINFSLTLPIFRNVGPSLVAWVPVILAGVVGSYSAKGRLPFWLTPAMIFANYAAMATLITVAHSLEIGYSFVLVSGVAIMLTLEAIVGTIASLTTLFVNRPRKNRTLDANR